MALAIVPAHSGVELGALVESIAAELRRTGPSEVVDRRAVEAALGRAGAADARDEESAGIALVRWLGERDAAGRTVLYVADPTWTPWTERALRQADHVLVVARAQDGPEPGGNEARLEALWSRTRAPHRSLVLLHEPGAEPRGTRAWLTRRSVDRHFHVRAADPGAVPRLVRLVTGRGLGLVLGGGGARGFAHLGVLRALEEAGVPVDAVGGTSMGAIVGAMPALGLDAAAAREVCRRYVSALFDPTVPVVSLLTGRRIGERLRAAFGDREIEDLPRPFFCVSTNLTRVQAVVHRRGDLFRAVRSSLSLPGIPPPISVEGDLHVDGGLIDNLPIETMAALCGGPVVAVDVSPEVDLRSELDLTRGVSGWRLLWQRLNPFSRTPALDVPTISSMLMRSVVVASLVKEREREAARVASLYLKLPLDEWGLLEFEKLDAIADRGLEASAERVRGWWRGGSQAPPA